LLPPQFKNNGAFTGNTYFDTAGFDGVLRVEFHVGTTDAIIGSNDTSHAPKLEGCDTYNGSYEAIEDAELSAVIGAGDDDKIFAIEVDLTKSHPRFIQVDNPVAASATGANLCIIGRASGGHVVNNAADMGLAELVQA
jgi:hypothetical protein